MTERLKRPDDTFALTALYETKLESATVIQCCVPNDTEHVANYVTTKNIHKTARLKTQQRPLPSNTNQHQT
jgi:hypothetical protein